MSDALNIFDISCHCTGEDWPQTCKKREHFQIDGWTNKASSHPAVLCSIAEWCIWDLKFSLFMASRLDSGLILLPYMVKHYILFDTPLLSSFIGKT